MHISCVNTVANLHLIILSKSLTLNSTSISSLCCWIISPRNRHCCFPHSSLPSLATSAAFYSQVLSMHLHRAFQRVGTLLHWNNRKIFDMSFLAITGLEGIINHTGKTLHTFRKRGVLLWQLPLGVSGNVWICCLCLYAEHSYTDNRDQVITA